MKVRAGVRGVPHLSVGSGGAWQGSSVLTARPGTHWGLGSNHPQDFSYDEPKVEFDVDAPSGVVMEGYLFKRASNAFKTWNR